ncbi:MAG: AAA family ATPase [Sulfuricurvum sp.]|nr:AAA family ATPase [Sulfuricurvum sp.]
MTNRMSLAHSYENDRIFFSSNGDAMALIDNEFYKLEWLERNYLEGMSVDYGNGHKIRERFRKLKNTLARNNSRLKYASYLTQNLEPPSWLIKGVLPERGLLEIIGASGSYKSFLVLDMLFCISSGIEYHGRKVKEGTVIYIAGEGAHGVKMRLKALQLHYGTDTYDFYVLPMPSNLSKSEEMEVLAKDISEIAPDGVAIIIFDTLHRNSAGTDENSSTDFATILSNIDTYIIKMSKVVGWVHHTGLSEGTSERGRGTSSRYGACDTVIVIKKDSDRIATMKCAKQKDSDPFEPIAFTMELIDVGITDDDGNDIMSLYPSEMEIKNTMVKQLSGNTLTILNVLKSSISTRGIELNDEVKKREGYIKGQGLSTIEWKNEAYKVISTSSSDERKERDAKSKSFNRAKKELLDRKIISEFDGIVWIREDCARPTPKDIFGQ